VATEPWVRSDAHQVTDSEAFPIKTVVAGHRMGETGLVRMALPFCRGRQLLILSGYHRVEPESLPGLLEALAHADMVVARRWPRRDTWINRLQGRLFHRLVGWMTGSRFSDLGSGVRAVRREVLEELPLYGDLYRFLPVLAVRQGYRVREHDCPQHRQDTRTRAYRPAVYLRRALDLLGLYFLVRFTEKPLRFFGLVGGGLSFGGLVILIVVIVQRLAGRPLADRPLLVLGVLFMVLGLQAIALGLIGEIIVHIHAGRFRRYRLARNIPPGGEEPAHPEELSA
jgi:hypothetical protein